MRRTLFFPAVFIQFLAIFVVTFVIGFTASEKVIAQQNAATDLASLLAKAQAKGEVPVIIKLNINFQPEGTLSSQQAIAQQKAIANAQNSIVQSLNVDIITGTIYGIWGDPPPATGQAPIQRFFLVDKRGKSISLMIDKKLIRSEGGIRALNGRRVSIKGRWVIKAEGREAAIFEVQSIQVKQLKNGAAVPQGQSGLCGRPKVKLP